MFQEEWIAVVVFSLSSLFLCIRLRKDEECTIGKPATTHVPYYIFIYIKMESLNLMATNE